MSSGDQFKIYVRNIFGVPLFAPRHTSRIRAIFTQIQDIHPQVCFFQEVFLAKDLRDISSLSSDTFSLYYNNTRSSPLGGGLCSLIQNNIQTNNEFIHFRKSGFCTDWSLVDKISRKGMHIIQIQDPFPCVLINTHLTCPYTEDLDHYPKMKQLLREQLADIEEVLVTFGDMPCILCGDFNLEPDQDILCDFIRKNNLVDVSSLIEKTYLGNFYTPRWLFRSTTNARKPDYIFAKNIPKKWSLSVEKIDDKEFFSDHSALLLSFTY